MKHLQLFGERNGHTSKESEGTEHLGGVLCFGAVGFEREGVDSQ